MNNVKTAVIPVAGNGLRALPGSKAIPKHFHFVAGNPVIYHCIQEALIAGIERFVFIVNSDPISKILIERQFLYFEELYETLIRNGKADIIPLLESTNLSGKDVCFVEQKDQIGLGASVLAAENILKEESHFCVLCPDDLILPSQGGLKEIIDGSKNYLISIGVEKTTDEELKKFGVVKMDENTGKIYYVIEKPQTKAEAPSNLVITGRFILPNNIFDILRKNVLALKEGKHTYSEVGLSDALEEYINRGELFGVIIKGKRFDCGNRIGLIEANFASVLLDEQIGPIILNKYFTK